MTEATFVQRGETRLQQRLEELCAASIRAMAGERDLRFRGHRLHRGDAPLPVYAPHLHPDFAHDDFASFRGAADGLALRLANSNTELHRSFAPADRVERLVFDWLEQYRVESLAPASLPGVARNLRHRHEAWSLGFHHAGHTEGARGLLLYTLAQVARARIAGEPVVHETEDVIEATRYALAPRIGHALAGMRRTRHDQAAFAVHALAAAGQIAAMLRDAAAADGADDGSDDAEAKDADAELRSVFGLLLDDADGAAGERFASAVTGTSRVLDAAAGAYRVFSTAWDREESAAGLVRGAALAEYRERLDRRMAAQGINVPRLARELHALFAVPVEAGWDDAQEEGRIDGRRLAQLVAAPAERRLFRQPRIEPTADAAVAFLVDCSGSMKAHAETVAVLVDTFARALEQAGVASEVLGFSTSAWNGGRAHRQWLRAGRPAHPGRLNERLHLVFKPFALPWRRARPGLAALLKHDLFREGLDGEAVDWAASRLASRDEARKVLVVISDGSPMDSATALANDAHYLDQHLRDVVSRLERSGAVEVHGIGVGLDLSPCYRSSRVLDLEGGIGNAVFEDVIATLARRQRRGSTLRAQRASQ